MRGCCGGTPNIHPPAEDGDIDASMHGDKNPVVPTKTEEPNYDDVDLDASIHGAPVPIAKKEQEVDDIIEYMNEISNRQNTIEAEKKLSNRGNFVECADKLELKKRSSRGHFVNNFDI
jgi:hypothetical protein